MKRKKSYKKPTVKEKKQKMYFMRGRAENFDFINVFASANCDACIGCVCWP